jgi:hypothetical protein
MSVFSFEENEEPEGDGETDPWLREMDRGEGKEDDGSLDRPAALTASETPEPEPEEPSWMRDSAVNDLELDPQDIEELGIIEFEDIPEVPEVPEVEEIDPFDFGPAETRR